MKMVFSGPKNVYIDLYDNDIEIFKRYLTEDDIIEWTTDLQDDLDQFVGAINTQSTQTLMKNVVSEWLYRLEMHYGIKIPLEVIDGTNNIQN